MAHTRNSMGASATIPASAGIGLRSAHHRAVIETCPPVGWFEVHSENYLGQGGAPLFYLEQVRAAYPVSLHGVGLSLGGTDPLDYALLTRLKALVVRVQPALVSEHLSWSRCGGVYFNDLLPLPYTEEALQHLTARIREVQDFLDRRILLENPSSYLEYAHSTVPEQEFLAEAARQSGCGILLDVNNLYVSCCNHAWDPVDYLDAIPGGQVGEIHLAGHTVNHFDGGEMLIDTHDRPVCETVWRLYAYALQRWGPRPTLLEWDRDLPPLQALLHEARKADRLLEACDAWAA